MPRRRHHKKYSLSRPVKLVKYSNETFSFVSTRAYNNGADAWVMVSKSTEVLGTRKAKNFTLTFTTGANYPFVFALVFVPEGTDPSPIQIGTQITSNYLISTSLYNPNQNVILQGIAAGYTGGPIRYKTRLARNLNSGDSVVLVLKPLIPYEGNIDICGTVNYAISY